MCLHVKTTCSCAALQTTFQTAFQKHALDKVLNLPCVVLTDMSNNLPNTHLKHICCELPLTFNGKMGFDPIDVTRTCRSGNVLPRQGKPMEIHGNPPVCEHQMNLSTHEIGDTDYIISTNHEKTQTDSTVNDHFFQ